MKVCGIIAEYNPFHTGHQYHIQKAREMGATHIAVVMSTSFVQRGEPAAFDFMIRAEAALENGADLVAALPAAYSMAGAERFCRAGVESLSLLCCDALSFGCETTGDELMLLQKNCREVLTSPLFAENMGKGMHFARARAVTCEQLFGNAAALNDANTALALGYLEANDRLAFPMEPFVIRRAGVSHDALQPEDGFASASYLRSNREAWETYLPQAELYQKAAEEGRIPDSILSDRLLTALLKTRSLSDWKETAGVREGLWNSLYRAAGEEMTSEGILRRCKSRRYPLSALRRMLWSAALGITDELQRRPVGGLWIIGTNERGREILSHARKCRKEREIQGIITPKFADYAKAFPDLAGLEQRAADLFVLCCASSPRLDLYRMGGKRP